MLSEDAPEGAEVPAPGRRVSRARRWDEVAGQAHESWAQEELRRGIRSGEIRLVPTPDGGVRILRSPKA